MRSFAMSDLPTGSDADRRPRLGVIALLVLLALATAAGSVLLHVLSQGGPRAVLYLPVLPMAVFIVVAAVGRLRGWLRPVEALLAGVLILTAHGASHPAIGGSWLAMAMARPVMHDTPGRQAFAAQIPAALSATVAPRTALGATVPAVTRLQQGLRSGDNPLGELPLAPLAAPAAAGLPILIGFIIVLVAMAAVTARQWNQHERLQQPLAQITGAMADGAIWRQRPFWVAVGAMALMWAWNLGGLNGLHPLPQLRFELKVSQLPDLLGLSQSGFSDVILRERWAAIGMQPLVIAVAFLLAAQMSFSMWGGFWIAMLVFGWLTAFGLPADFTTVGRTEVGNGAMLAMAVVIVWLGRHHYWALLKAAIGIGDAAGDRAGVWGVRVLVVGAVALGAALAHHAGSWAVGAVAVVLPLAVCLVIGRIIAEAGLPAFQTPEQIARLATTLGVPMALPFQALFVVQWFAVTMLSDTRDALAGHLGHAGGLATRGGLSPRWWLAIGALAIAALLLGVAMLVGATWTLPRWSGGQLDDISRGWQISATTLGSGTWGDVAAKIGSGGILWGVGLVAALVALRRFWGASPFHPLALCVAFSWPVIVLWSSLMFGWLAKVLVLRYGGVALYTRLKPVAFGLIVGDLAGWTADYGLGVAMALFDVVLVRAPSLM